MSSNPASSPWEPPSIEKLQAMLPQYEITGVLGRGGMGAVYRGRQAKLNRDVAIKLLPEHLAGENDELNFAARFEQEAQAMAGLDHPAIVSVHDFGETSAGQLYFVMEFVDGMDIHQYLAVNGGRLEQEHALAIASHVLDALDYAHSRGIVHRDIKPANVLLNQDGRVKIADFGLAKRFAIDDEGGDSGPALTMANVAVGTPDFVAPEALEDGKTPDHRADLYAVGVMLYQMLTGTLPRGKFKTPSEHRPELDPRLDAVVGRAMQTDPDDRYSSAAEIRADLDATLTQPITKLAAAAPEPGAGESSQAVPVAMVAEDGKKSKVGLWVGVGIAALTVIVGTVLFLYGDKNADNAGSGDAPAVVSGGDQTAKPSDTNGSAAADDLDEAKPETPAPTTPTPEPKPTAITAAEPLKPEPAPEPKTAAPDLGAPAATPETTKPPQTASANPPTPKPEPKPDAEKLLPELATRLSNYLAARRTQIEGLANRYLTGLNGHLEAAANDGNLSLVNAYRGEAAALAELGKALAADEGTLSDRVRSSATLPDLPQASPEALVKLRNSWAVERAKIQATLDRQLGQSLKSLEQELTKARDYDKAEAVLAYRNTLAEPTTVAAAEKTPTAKAGPTPTPAAAQPATPAENPFGWKPIPAEPFPLPRPQRQTTPCRLVAWRIDGEAVDESKFREKFGGVPADFGDIVDFDASHSIGDEAKQTPGAYPLLAIRADGSVAQLQWAGEWQKYEAELRDVVAISVGRFASIALRGDGTVVPMEWNPGAFDKDGHDLSAASQWKNIVQVCGGDFLVGGLTADGTPVFVGDNRYKQGEAPADLSTQILAVDVKNVSSYSVLLQRLDAGFRVERFGQYQNSLQLSADDRWFIGAPSFTADRQGRLTGELMHSNAPNKVKSIRGAGPRDVIRVEFAQNFSGLSDVGLSAACSTNDEWEFWGDLPGIGKFDDKFCNEKAKGAWKLAIMYPYAVALKPVASLTPEDWTGAPASKVTTAQPPTPTSTAPSQASEVDPSVNPFGWKPIPDDPFPLVRPQRQTTPCRLVAWRADGKPVDEAHFRDFYGGVPADLGEIVDFDGYPSLAGPESKPYPLISYPLMAIRADGTSAAMNWSGEAVQKKAELHDVVQVSVGAYAAIALRGDGTVVAMKSNHGSWQKIGLDLDGALQWRNVARISAGLHQVAGVTTDGRPLFAGDNRHGQGNPPADLQSRIVDVDQTNAYSTSTLVQQLDDGYRIELFGRQAWSKRLQRGDRWFLALDSYSTDPQGRLQWSSAIGKRPNSVASIRGAGPRDVIRVECAMNYDGGVAGNAAIAAACSKNDEWEFWGATEGAGDFDAKYCDEKAKGAWKLRIMHPYIVALKPAAKVTAEDWIGSAAPAAP